MNGFFTQSVVRGDSRAACHFEGSEKSFLAFRLRRRRLNEALPGFPVFCSIAIALLAD